MIFVKNKEFSPVLDMVKNSTQEHDNFLRFVSKQEDGWYNFKFHIYGDKNREVKLAVLLFHIPE